IPGICRSCNPSKGKRKDNRRVGKASKSGESDNGILFYEPDATMYSGLSLPAAAIGCSGDNAISG
ncbi:hypothetical protein OFB92_27660, partial [Escherichia coli]|nr:hypothetical protein [Escherichia coli]